MSNHGYLKVGQWFELLAGSIYFEQTSMLVLSPISNIVFAKYTGRRENLMEFSIKGKNCWCHRSDIKYRTISPSKSKHLEVLYGNTI